MLVDRTSLIAVFLKSIKAEFISIFLVSYNAD